LIIFVLEKDYKAMLRFFPKNKQLPFLFNPMVGGYRLQKKLETHLFCSGFLTF